MPEKIETFVPSTGLEIVIKLVGGQVFKNKEIAEVKITKLVYDTYICEMCGCEFKEPVAIEVVAGEEMGYLSSCPSCESQRFHKRRPDD
jgi:DNA-directed RNA polymerase subunit RPC12/RpoP